MTPFSDPAVVQAFDAAPLPVRKRLLVLRELILKTAAANAGVGDIEETLKWGEPAYLTTASRSGSTIRIGWKPASPDRYALYFNCKTDLIETFKTIFPNDFQFEGNRALVFDVKKPLPDATAFCIDAAFNYHKRKGSPLNSVVAKGPGRGR